MCTHDPLTDIRGNIISPRVHYGDGADGNVECLRCKGWWKLGQTPPGLDKGKARKGGNESE
jgi:hypothetical protein